MIQGLIEGEGGGGLGIRINPHPKSQSHQLHIRGPSTFIKRGKTLHECAIVCTVLVLQP